MISSSSCEIAFHAIPRAVELSAQVEAEPRLAGHDVHRAGERLQLPTVPMTWCSARQIRSIASAASLAPRRASRRRSYGVPPACRASPSTTTWKRRALAIDETIASDSSLVELRTLLDVGLEVAHELVGATGRLTDAARVEPDSRNASRRVVPSASVSPHHESSQSPAAAAGRAAPCRTACPPRPRRPPPRARTAARPGRAARRAGRSAAAATSSALEHAHDAVRSGRVGHRVEVRAEHERGREAVADQ